MTEAIIGDAFKDPWVFRGYMVPHEHPDYPVLDRHSATQLAHGVLYSDRILRSSNPDWLNGVFVTGINLYHIEGYIGEDLELRVYGTTSIATKDLTFNLGSGQLTIPSLNKSLEITELDGKAHIFRNDTDSGLKYDLHNFVLTRMTKLPEGFDSRAEGFTGKLDINAHAHKRFKGFLREAENNSITLPYSFPVGEQT